MRMIKIVEDIKKLLLRCNVATWEKTIDELIKLLKTGEYEKASRIVMSIFGGMGSFSDIVLYENGQVLYDENNLLDKLRNELFEEAKKHIN